MFWYENMIAPPPGQSQRIVSLYVKPLPLPPALGGVTVRVVASHYNRRDGEDRKMDRTAAARCSTPRWPEVKG